MQTRLLRVLVVIAVMLAAVPLVATAATPNTARISAVSYRDLAGSETNSLCAPVQSIGPSIQTTISYSGTGAELGGSGTGEMSITLYGPTFDFTGQATVNGKTLMISGTGTLSCLMSGYALVAGTFNAYATSGQVTAAVPVQGVSGSLFGYISDGVHPSQGRVSLTLREEEQPPTTSLDVQTTLDGTAAVGVPVTIYEGGVCGVGASQTGTTGADGVASFLVTGETQYCASADSSADTTPTTILVSVPVGDPVDVDALIADTTPVVTSVDALVTLDGVPTAGVTVTFYADGTCTSVLGTGTTNGSGIASLVVAGAGTYCASADPNADATASNTGAMTIADGDPVDTDGTIAETTPVVTSVDVLVTLDGVAATGVVVNFFSDAACLISAGNATTGPAGVASLVVAGAGTYCATADPNADAISTLTVPMIIALGDPVDTDGTIAETTPVVTSVDVLVTLDGVAASGVSVNFYSDSTCTTLIGPATTNASGIASMTVAGSGTYCASADPNADATATNTGAMAIVDGDPVDTDGTIAELPAGTFIDVVVTLNGTPVQGITVSFCNQFICGSTTVTAVTDVNGRATITATALVGPGENLVASANADGLGPVTQAFFTIPLNDPSGDTDATLADVTPPEI